MRFPVITIRDMVRAHVGLLDALGVERLHAVVGGSMGGMQALSLAANWPERAERVLVVASTSRHSAQNIGFHELGRQAIMADPRWQGGDYYAGETPDSGLAVARMAAHITYLSEEALTAKFGRNLQDREAKTFGFEADFQVESYLRYQGERFSKNFDANTYLLMTKALDYFDPTRGYQAQIEQQALSDNETKQQSIDQVIADAEQEVKEAAVVEGSIELNDLKTAFAHAQCQYLIVSFTTDWRFAPERSQEIVDALMATGKPVSYTNIDAPHGHDSFLFDIPRYMGAIKGFLTAPFISDHNTTDKQQPSQLTGARS